MRLVGREATVTYLPDKTSKQGGYQRDRIANREAKENQRHEKGKTEIGESTGAVESRTASGKESCDVKATCEVAITQTLRLGSENAGVESCNRQET